MCNGRGARIIEIMPGVVELDKCECAECQEYRKISQVNLEAFLDRFEDAYQEYQRARSGTYECTS